MNIEAQPVEGDARGDIIKLGLSEIASNDIKDGEDTEDIPVITMSDSYLDLYMKEANGMTYWKNTKEMISPEEGQAWIINGYSANSNSDVRLSWTMDELEEAFDIEIPEEQAEKITTVAQAIECITQSVDAAKADG